MKKLTLLSLSFFILISASFAQKLVQKVNSFNKIIVSPNISLELNKGEKEQVAFQTFGVHEDDVVIEVRGKTLHIYLEGNKIFDRDDYYNEEVAATVTFKELKKLQVRGAEEVNINDAISAKKFTLKLFGETDVRMAGIEADRLKVALYGENDLSIKTGRAEKQIYKSYGENIVRTRNVEGTFTKTKMYGESDMTVNASRKLRVNSFGESDVLLVGDGKISRGIVIGENRISKLRYRADDSKN